MIKLFTSKKRLKFLSILCIILYLSAGTCALVARYNSEAYIGAGILSLQLCLLSITLTICLLVTWLVCRTITPDYSPISKKATPGKRDSPHPSK